MTDEQQSVKLSEASPSVQTHLGILQGVIVRMASNSTSCKAWCITVVCAVLVIIADKGKPDFALIAFIPNFLFMALDAYYLAMEKGFRNSYNSFVKKTHEASLTTEDLYFIKPEGNLTALQLEAIKSFSVWGFYIVLALLITLTRWLVLA